MTKQEKARAHLARAQELLQGYGSSPYNTRVTSNEALGFGTNGTGDGTNNKLEYEKLPLEARIMIESNLNKKEQLKLTLSAKESSPAYQAYKKLHKGWTEDNANVMNDKGLVLTASIFSPMVYGYASEELQNDKDLAWQMHMKNPKSIYAYAWALDDLPVICQKIIKKERERRELYCRVRYRELEGVLYGYDQHNPQKNHSYFTKPMKWKPGIVDDAIFLGRPDIIREILEDPAARTRIEDKIHGDYTALLYAVHSGEYHIANLLINSGADINAKCLISRDQPVHYTTLDFAISKALDNSFKKTWYEIDGPRVEGDSVSFVTYLLKKGAHANMLNNDTMTMLRALNTQEKRDILEILKGYGFNDDRASTSAQDDGSSSDSS